MRTTKASRAATSFFEMLEPRCVLSATTGTEVTPNLLVLADASSAASIAGYTPAQIKAAYGFSNVTFGTVKGDGSGETIAIVDAYNDPNILSDLAVFDAQNGIAAPPSIKVENQTGGTRLPANSRGWATEIALDVEWAHAIAPGANNAIREMAAAMTMVAVVPCLRCMVLQLPPGKLITE